MLSVSSKQKLTLVNKKLEDAVKRLHEAALKEGLDVQVACGFRPQAIQDDLWKQGRTRPGPIVTWTRHSKHSLGLAVDLFFMVNGKADWGIGKFVALGKIAAKECPELEWSGNWKIAREFCHFQLKE
jgi:peptidoglycan L-alanyl-D-glutamate endopeptidase CwlK